MFPANIHGLWQVVAVVLRLPCGPTPRGTLHSETILRNKLTSLNLETNIAIYTIMTIKGTARRAWHLADLVQNVWSGQSCHSSLPGRSWPDGHEGCQGDVFCFDQVKLWYWINYPSVDGAVLINLSVIWMNWLASMHNLKMVGRSFGRKKIMVWLSPCHLSLGDQASGFLHLVLIVHSHRHDKVSKSKVHPCQSWNYICPLEKGPA